MIAWWWLLIACPASAVLGMWWTGGRWQRAWIARDGDRSRRSPYRSGDPSPVRCTHEGGEWPGLDRCADCSQTLGSGDPS